MDPFTDSVFTWDCSVACNEMDHSVQLIGFNMGAPTPHEMFFLSSGAVPLCAASMEPRVQRHSSQNREL